MKHQFQHPDSPTWCIHCGRFAHLCGSEDCDGTEGSFDSRTPEVFERMFQDIFGGPTETVIDDLANFEVGGEG